MERLPDTHQRRLDQCQVGPELAVDGQACTARGRYDGIDARYRSESSGLSAITRAKAGVGFPDLPAGGNRLPVQR
jgi:IS5 family transposase